MTTAELLDALRAELRYARRDRFPANAGPYDTVLALHPRVRMLVAAIAYIERAERLREKVRAYRLAMVSEGLGGLTAAREAMFEELDDD